jgi:hypothetical protein
LDTGLATYVFRLLSLAMGLMLERLILVSNRLAVTVRRGRDGVPTQIRSSGGMVAALGPVHEAGDGMWLGNIGDQLDPDVEATLADNRYVRVPVSSSENTAYYLGYSNSAVWPLFHYLPERVRFNRSQFAVYKEINQRFADLIVEIAKPAHRLGFTQDSLSGCLVQIIGLDDCESYISVQSDIVNLVDLLLTALTQKTGDLIPIVGKRLWDI